MAGDPQGASGPTAAERVAREIVLDWWGNAILKSGAASNSWLEELIKRIAAALDEAQRATGASAAPSSEAPDGWQRLAEELYAELEFVEMDHTATPGKTMLREWRARIDTLKSQQPGSTPVASPAPPGGASGADGASLRERLRKAAHAACLLAVNPRHVANDLGELCWCREDARKQRKFSASDFHDIACVSMHRALVGISAAWVFDSAPDMAPASPPPDPATREEA